MDAPARGEGSESGRVRVRRKVSSRNLAEGVRVEGTATRSVTPKAVERNGHANGNGHRPGSGNGHHHHGNAHQSSSRRAQVDDLKGEVAKALKEDRDVGASIEMVVNKAVQEEVRKALLLVKEEIRAEVRAELQGEEAKKAGEGALEDIQPRISVGLDEMEEVELQESIWDTSLLLFSEPVGMAASIFVLLLILLNAIGQGLFTYIVLETGLTEETYKKETVKEFQQWRRGAGHHVKFYDQGLEMAGSQSASFAEVNEYLYCKRGSCDVDDKGSPTYLGVMMCTFCMAMWFLTVSKELTSVWQSSRAFCTIPRVSSSLFQPARIVPDREGGLRIVSIGWVQYVLCMTVLGLRAAIAGTLMFTGGKYLAYTISLGDLLLNAVALEFVVSIDELIYEALAPVRVQRALRSVVPFKLPQPKSWGGLNARPPLKALGVAAILTYFLTELVLPQHQTLEAVWDAICGGERGFVYTMDGMGSPLWAFEEGNPVNRSTFTPGWNSSKRNSTTVGYTLSSEAGDGYSLSFGSSVIDFVLQGKYYDDCPIETACYSLLTGLPLAPEEQPGCCLVQQTKSPSLVGGRLSVLSKSTETTLQATLLWNPQCVNTLDITVGTLYRNLLIGILIDAAELEGQSCDGDGDASLDSDGDEDPTVDNCPSETPFCNPDGVCIEANCKAVEPFCNLPSLPGLRARQMCPIQCGCDDPRSNLALSEPQSGCPETCTKKPWYIFSLSTMPCEDVTTRAPQRMSPQDPRFASFLLEWLEASTAWPTDWKTLGSLGALNLQLLGCEWLEMNHTDYIAYGVDKYLYELHALIDTFTATHNVTLIYPASPVTSYLIGNNWCISGGTSIPVQALSTFCPRTCGCAAGEAQCPDSCPRRNLTDILYTGADPATDFLAEVAEEAISNGEPGYTKML